jgi:hypothetical protein
VGVTGAVDAAVAAGDLAICAGLLLVEIVAFFRRLLDI